MLIHTKVTNGITTSDVYSERNGLSYTDAASLMGVHPHDIPPASFAMEFKNGILMCAATLDVTHHIFIVIDTK